MGKALAVQGRFHGQLWMWNPGLGLNQRKSMSLMP